MQSTIIRWSIVHALVLVGATLVAAVMDGPSIPALLGTLSLLGFIFLYWKRWTPDGSFGRANLLTLVRLTGVGGLVALAPHVSSPVIAPIGIVLLIADGVDGWLARRHHQVSPFGEYFDKETDAFLLLVVCLLLTSYGLVGSWILGGGVLRYLFVLTGRVMKGRELSERKSRQGRAIYIVVTVLLLTCFLPYPSLHLPLALMAMGLLTYSFAGDFRQIISTG